jgi:hypothetical protein
VLYTKVKVIVAQGSLPVFLAASQSGGLKACEKKKGVYGTFLKRRTPDVLTSTSFSLKWPAATI